MKGETLLINGDRWVIVDVAPAAPLAEMVAAILEEEGFVAMTRGPDVVTDVFSHLGTTSLGTTFVLVPEGDAAAALELIEATVTDYEGDELAALLEGMAENAGDTDDGTYDDVYDDTADEDSF